MPCEVTASVSILMASSTISMCVATVFLQPSSQASDLCFHTSDYIQNTLRSSVFLKLSSSTGTLIPKIKCLEASYSLDPGDTHSTLCTSHGPNDSSSWWYMTDFFWIPDTRFNYHLTLLISTLKKSKSKGNGNEIKGLILLLNTKLILPLGRTTMVWRNPELIHNICEGFMIHLPAASRPINQSTSPMKYGESNWSCVLSPWSVRTA